MDSQNLNKEGTRIAEVKTESPKYYKHPTRFAVLKADIPNLNNFAKRFAEVKPESPKL